MATRMRDKIKSLPAEDRAEIQRITQEMLAELEASEAASSSKEQRSDRTGQDSKPSFSAG